MFVAMKTRLLVTLALFVITTATSAVAAQFKALLITKTDGWHHDSLVAAVPAMQQLAKLHDFELVWPNNMASVLTDKGLADFQVIIFLLTTGNVLNDEQQAAVERFVQSGKGFAAIHTGTDTEYDWPWYTKMMGAQFHIHPAVQTATVVVQDRNFPGMDLFAPRSLRTEEWYQFKTELPEGPKVLLTVDETTYNPHANWGAKKGDGMGDLHPISWYHEYDGGRAFQTALGHLPATYSEPIFLHHVYGGIYWAATGKGFKAE
jgi:type 1 glutamine amidotransferase